MEPETGSSVGHQHTEEDGCGFTVLFSRKDAKNSVNSNTVQPTTEEDGTTAVAMMASCSRSSGDHHSSEESSAALPVPDGYLKNTQFCYNMTHSRRGKLTIISNRYFLPTSPMYAWPRHGTEYDVEDLRLAFRELGFDCEVHEDKTSAEMLNIFVNASRSEDYDCDCMAFVLLSHGEDGGMIHGTDDVVAIDQLLLPLKHEPNMKHFAGKPKLVFVQACRGIKLDAGIEVKDEKGKVEVQVQRIPIEADFLYMYSSAPGYFAFRGRYGTPFIRAVCDMLHEHHTSLDLMHILTRVCYDVAFFFESLVSRTNPDHVILSYKKQMPTIVSMLTKDVYFVPKLPPPMQDKQQDDVQ